MAVAAALPHGPRLPMSTITAVDDRLHVVPTLTAIPHPDALTEGVDPCAGTYTCPCWRCVLERDQRVRNGVRPDHSNPLRRVR